MYFVTVLLVRGAWKRVKDRYMKNLSEIEKNDGNDPNKIVEKYKYFDNVKFLNTNRLDK